MINLINKNKSETYYLVVYYTTLMKIYLFLNNLARRSSLIWNGWLLFLAQPFKCVFSW